MDLLLSNESYIFFAIYNKNNYDLNFNYVFRQGFSINNIIYTLTQ